MPVPSLLMRFAGKQDAMHSARNTERANLTPTSMLPIRKFMKFVFVGGNIELQSFKLDRGPLGRSVGQKLSDMLRYG